MNEIEMAYILNELDKSGVKVGFGNQVPAQLANGNKHYATGYMTGAVPTSMMNNMFAQGVVGGIGLIIEGEKETPELMKLVSYLSKNPCEGASLVKFCQNCLTAGNKPVRVLEDGTDKYFLCSNGKVLVRNGDEFTVYYEGTELPNMDGMSDRQRISILHATKETYNNLTEEDYEEEQEYEEEEDYEEEEEDLSDILITTARQILSNCSLDLRNHIEDLIEGIERAERNDDTIRKEALTDALASCLKAYKKREWEGKCKNNDWNF